MPPEYVTASFEVSENYHANAQRCKGNQVPCCVCGKPTNGNTKFLHVVSGGLTALHPSEEERYTTNQYDANLLDSGDCGLQPVGSDCLRNNPQLKPYAV